MKVLVERNNHLYRKQDESGLVNCRNCGSKLEVTRSDFKHPYIGHPGMAKCPVEGCRAVLSEPMVEWGRYHITSEMVKTLHILTGRSLRECHILLDEVKGDMVKAFEHLARSGMSLAAALEEAKTQVENCPEWLRSIYERNDHLRGLPKSGK